jgi:hypothetical protein
MRHSETAADLFAALYGTAMLAGPARGGDPAAPVTFNRDILPILMIWFLPHMHLRGKVMTYRLQYPGGRSEIVLSVKYDFNWQMAYDVDTPIPRGMSGGLP